MNSIGETGVSPVSGSQWTDRQMGPSGSIDSAGNPLFNSIVKPQVPNKMHGNSSNGSKPLGELDQSTMHNTSLQQPSHGLEAAGSIESTIHASMRPQQVVGLGI